jgi:hypothetical protein
VAATYWKIFDLKRMRATQVNRARGGETPDRILTFSEGLIDRVPKEIFLAVLVAHYQENAFLRLAALLHPRFAQTGLHRITGQSPERAQ